MTHEASHGGGMVGKAAVANNTSTGSRRVIILTHHDARADPGEDSYAVACLVEVVGAEQRVVLPLAEAGVGPQDGAPPNKHSVCSKSDQTEATEGGGADDGAEAGGHLTAALAGDGRQQDCRQERGTARSIGRG